MKEFGYFLVFIGVCYLLYAFNMDVSVTTPVTTGPFGSTYGGDQIANIDLMARRQNHLIVACLVTFVGAMMAIFGHRDGTGMANGGRTKSQKITGQFDGERDLSNDAYRLWLASAYSIERNEVFDRFVIGEATFDDLDAALAHADQLEQQKALKADEAAQRRRAEVEEREAQAVIAAEKAEAEWQAYKPKMIAGVIIIAIVLVAIIYFSRETPEGRELRLADEAAALERIQQEFGVSFPDDVLTVIEQSNTSGSKDYYCGDMKTGDLIEFKTNESAQSVKDKFAETLGEGEAKYDFMAEGDWRWHKDSNTYHFTHLSGKTMTLCKVSEDAES